MELISNYNKPTCQDYHEKKFDEYNFDWKLIYRISCIATFETKILIFQYSSLTMYYNLNKKLFHFDIIFQSNCSFYDLYDKTPQHLFYEWAYAQNLWNQLRLCLSEKVALPLQIPQSAIFCFNDVLHHNYFLVNYLFLIFKWNVHNSRVNNTLSLQSPKYVISQIKYIEETISENDLNKKEKFEINGN